MMSKPWLMPFASACRTNVVGCVRFMIVARLTLCGDYPTYVGFQSQPVEIPPRMSMSLPGPDNAVVRNGRVDQGAELLAILPFARRQADDATVVAEEKPLPVEPLEECWAPVEVYGVHGSVFMERRHARCVERDGVRPT